MKRNQKIQLAIGHAKLGEIMEITLKELRIIITKAIFEAKKGEKGKKLTGSAGKLRGKSREGRLKMEKPGGEIDKCKGSNPPKSCYDEWENDKKYKSESIIREAVREILLEKKKKKPGPKPKKKKKDDKKKNKGADIKTGNLSASTVKKITKIAKDRGYTVGSMKKEYVLGLKAWTAGHPPGVPQHAWATARIKKATPGKSWSVVKKSKAKNK